MGRATAELSVALALRILAGESSLMRRRCRLMLPAQRVRRGGPRVRGAAGHAVSRQPPNARGPLFSFSGYSPSTPIA